MTDDQSYPNLPDYVDEAMETLRDEPLNSPEYCIAKGSLYDNLRSDVRASSIDALHISRMLGKGEVEETLDRLEEVFEDE